MARTITKPRSQSRRAFRFVDKKPVTASDVSPKDVGSDVPAVSSKKSKKTQLRTKLRTTITPGTILILLAGRFRGKRVVFLKQLESGLLLITGPFKINGVPLRRVNQAYVIATSTKIEIDSSIADKFTDAYFAKEISTKKQSAEAEFFEDGKPKAKEPFPQAKAADQKEVDGLVIGAVKKQEYLWKYLKSSWGLSKGEFPHKLVF